MKADELNFGRIGMSEKLGDGFIYCVVRVFE